MDLRVTPPVIRVPLPTNNGISLAHAFGPQSSLRASIIAALHGKRPSGRSNNQGIFKDGEATYLDVEVNPPQPWTQALASRMQTLASAKTFDIAPLTSRISMVDRHDIHPSQPTSPFTILLGLGIKSQPLLSGQLRSSYGDSEQTTTDLENANKPCLSPTDLRRLLTLSNAPLEEWPSILNRNGASSPLVDILGGLQGEINFSDHLPMHLDNWISQTTNGNTLSGAYWGVSQSILEAILLTSSYETQSFVLDLWSLGPLPSSSMMNDDTSGAQRLGVAPMLPFEELLALKAMLSRPDPSQFFIERGAQSLFVSPFHPEVFIVGSGRGRGPMLSSRGSLKSYSMLPHWSMLRGEEEEIMQIKTSSMYNETTLNAAGCRVSDCWDLPDPVTHLNILGTSYPQLILAESMAGPTWRSSDNTLGQDEAIDCSADVLFSSGSKLHLVTFRHARNTTEPVINPYDIRRHQLFKFRQGPSAGPIACAGPRLIGVADQFSGVTTLAQVSYEFHDTLAIQAIAASHLACSPKDPIDLAFVFAEGTSYRYLRLVVADGANLWTMTYPSSNTVSDHIGGSHGGLVAPKMEELADLETLHIREWLKLPSAVVHFEPFFPINLETGRRCTQQIALLASGALYCVRVRTLT